MTVIPEKQEHLKSVLHKMVINPESVTPELVVSGLRSIARGEASDAQMGGFMTALKMLGIDRKPEMLAVIAGEVLRSAAIPCIDFDGKTRDDYSMIVDIVGTGGDGWNTFNISTTSSLIAAAAGLTVTKHGSRALTSNSGSADILESMGCNLSAVLPAHVGKLLAEHRYCFILVDNFHTTILYVRRMWKELGIPTPFKILGPITNPVVPNRAVIGVNSKELGPVMAEALRILGRCNYAVVCGDEDLDEISIAGDTHVWHIQESGEIKNYTIHPRDFGVPAHPLSKAAGATLEENKATLHRLLSNELEDKDIAVRDFVLINTGFLLFVAGMASSMEEGATIARQTLESGKVMALLESFGKATRAL
ncbi:anthranilate phosphoribosyltransferase [Coemansia aciculifera]|uniref:Anthranilate phosphoribosyltransferase n=1 Tax=Coemansia aciculifera TaxID=417176 RepID=A0ACC1M7W9_9FUNG|nr:anthranilate phosphoribosyltransferase [Coemansia aciculifera]